tara:strand:+ start:1058 stop:1387 length:330 start_codon:yes stop_codon:yes gene_type:complete
MEKIEAALISTEELIKFAEDFGLGINIGTVQYSSSFRKIVWRFDLNQISECDSKSAGRIWETYSYERNVTDGGAYTHEGIVKVEIKNEALTTINLRIEIANAFRKNFAT